MKIALVGYGKMGKTIEQLAPDMGHEVVLKIGRNNVQDLTKKKLQEADAVIEFSRPEVAYENIRFCLEAGLPVVSGTTGWLDRKPEIEDYCRTLGGAFLYASNFSVGVNLFFAVNEYLARLMQAQQSYEVEIEEIHHTQKLDAPSGTAITLAEQILAQIHRKKQWVKETGLGASDLVIHSKRIDQVPGTHLINYSSAIDTIEIKHTAHNREGFAFGALHAAAWIQGKQGVFTMREVLGL